MADLQPLDGFGGLHRLRDDVLQPALDAAITVLRDQSLLTLWVDENAANLRRFCGMDVVCRRYVELYQAAGAA